MDLSGISFILRSLNPFTLSGHWYLRIIGLVAVLVFAPVLWEWMVSHNDKWFEVGTISFILVGLVIGALEEIGWRGYAQEALQRHFPIALAALSIGIFWAVWHLPLFFCRGPISTG